MFEENPNDLKPCLIVGQVIQSFHGNASITD